MNLNSKEIDWLQISRLGPCHSQSIVQLSHILTGRTISQGMFQRLPKTYLAKLLRSIRESLVTADKNSFLIGEILQEKDRQKVQLIEFARKKQAILMESKAKLVAQHEQIKSKTQLLKALQKKIKNKRTVKEQVKQKTSQLYYCPFCRRSDYKDKSQFEKHMSQAHMPADNNIQNFILSLKDKELAIMKIVMKKNDEVNEAAKTLLDREMKLLTAGFQQKYQQKQTKMENCQEGQLMTESEYIEFQKQNASTENKPIFWSTKEISEKYKPKPITHSKQIHIMPSLYDQRHDKTHKMTETKKYMTRQDTKHELSSSVFANQSIYKTHNSVQSDRMAYHSGPLVDDQGSGSDIEDYFYKKPQVPLIIDEQINIDSRLLAKLQQPSVNMSISKSNVSKVRLPSQLLSADDSVEDRDFSLSKDESDINLSDLRYSKVLRRQEKKAQQKAQLFPVQEKQEPLSTQKSSYLSNFMEFQQPNRLMKEQTPREQWMREIMREPMRQTPREPPQQPVREPPLKQPPEHSRPDILSQFYSSHDNFRKTAKTERSQQRVQPQQPPRPAQPPRKMKKTEISLTQIKQQLNEQSIYS